MIIIKLHTSTDQIVSLFRAKPRRQNVTSNGTMADFLSAKLRKSLNVSHLLRTRLAVHITQQEHQQQHFGTCNDNSRQLATEIQLCKKKHLPYVA
jgi:hypothetical protein